MRPGSVLVSAAVVATVIAFGIVAWYVVFPTPRVNSLGPGPIEYLPLSGPQDGAFNGRDTYNFTVVGASEIPNWGQTFFEVQDQGGANISSKVSGLNLTVEDSSGHFLASFEFGDTLPGWNVGSSTVISEGQRVDLSSAGSAPLGNDTLLVVERSHGVEGFSLA